MRMTIAYQARIGELSVQSLALRFRDPSDLSSFGYAGSIPAYYAKICDNPYDEELMLLLAIFFFATARAVEWVLDGLMSSGYGA